MKTVEAQKEFILEYLDTVRILTKEGEKIECLLTEIE